MPLLKIEIKYQPSVFAGKKDRNMAQKTGAWMALLMVVILGTAGAAAGQEHLKPRMVIDQAGRQVMIPGVANKIVTTFKPATLCLLSLGLAPRLVGVDNSSKRDLLSKAVFPKITQVAGIGTKSMGINFETLVSLEPDLVILYSQKDGLQVADRLAALNIPAIVILPESFQTIQQSLALIARAVGGDTNILIVQQQMDTLLDLIRERLKDLPQNKRKTGYFASSRGVFSTTTGNMIQHEIFTTAGIENVSADLTGYFQDISPEQLFRWNPDIMVLSRHMKRNETARLANKALSQVSAISTRQVFRCPSSLSPWDFPSPLSVLASLWLAKRVYPEYFSDIDLGDRTNAFHRALFGKTMDEMGGDLDDTLQWKQ
jgi:iron complex transport system substrate-binding protein